jgi:DNA-binding HxlR family transcriptional regulator
MLGSDYAGQTCSIARALELVGERWTMLIVREIFLGVRRFEDIRADLGIARNVLAARLERLVAAGILEKARYQDRPPRHEYRLTERGLDLWPVLIDLMAWGDRHAPTPGGPPVVLRHRECGGAVGPGRACDRCGALIERGDAVAEAGPGASADHPLRRRVAPASAATPGH